MYIFSIDDSYNLIVFSLDFAETISVAAMSSGPKSYETLAVTVPQPFVYNVEFNRPKKLNAFSRTMWR